MIFCGLTSLPWERGWGEVKIKEVVGDGLKNFHVTSFSSYSFMGHINFILRD
jgi:hypothetical protein